MTEIDAHRRNARRARSALTSRERAWASSKIVRRFCSSNLFYRARIIACYLPTLEEVDTLSLLDRAWRARKTICVPVIGKASSLHFVELRPDTKVVRNRYGIFEPEERNVVLTRDLDVCVVPTVAFDDSRHRIGMGGGYYDRHFEFVRRPRRWLRPKLVGFAFECQRVDNIQSAPWDVSLHRIVTENDIV